MSWGPSEDETDDGGEEPGGWVPPEARTWRHPSELRAGQVAIALAAVSGWRRGATVLVGITGLLAIAIGAALLASTGASPRAVTLTTMPVDAATTPCCTLTTAATRDAETAVVSLEPDGSHSAATSACGVVIGEGLVATTQRALGGARRVHIVTATGTTLAAAVVASDPESGIALLRTKGTLPATPAISASDVSPGSPALAVAMRKDGRSTAPRALWSSGTIVTVGKAAPGDSPDMAEITVHGPSLADVQGEPLVDERGRILGILDGAAGTQRWFLPMSLVTGVSLDLETIGRVRHGWLGITDGTSAGPTGAEILSVLPHSAADGALQPGEVIERLDGIRITSSAQLRSLLYVMAPGTPVTLEVSRAGHPATMVVQLQPSP